MAWFVARRFSIALLVLLVLSMIAFGIVRVMPGDPAVAFLNVDNPDPGQLAEIRTRLGLDRPWLEQYLNWMSGVVRGDFGTSLTRPYQIGQQLATRLPVSLELAGMATVLAVLIGVPAGIVAAVRPGVVDRIVRANAFVLMSVPAFILGTLIILINSQTVRVRLVGYVPFVEDPLENLRLMLLPALLLGFAMAALISRYTRGSLLDTLSQDYVRTARAKGASVRRIVLRHALRNGLIPVTTVIGIELATLIGGTIVIESVFAMPGIGSLLIESINSSDYPTIQSCILVLGAVYVAINLIVDLLYPVIDPRVRVA